MECDILMVYWNEGTHMCIYTGLSSFLGLPLWLLYLRYKSSWSCKFEFFLCFAMYRYFWNWEMFAQCTAISAEKRQLHSFRWEAGNRRPQWSVSFFNMAQCHYRWSRLGKKNSAYNTLINVGWISQGRAFPIQAWTGPLASRRLRIPGFLDSWHMKVVRLCALRTCRLYPSGNICGTHFCRSQ